MIELFCLPFWFILVDPVTAGELGIFDLGGFIFSILLECRLFALGFGSNFPLKCSLSELAWRWSFLFH